MYLSDGRNISFVVVFNIMLEQSRFRSNEIGSRDFSQPKYTLHFTFKCKKYKKIHIIE